MDFTKLKFFLLLITVGFSVNHALISEQIVGGEHAKRHSIPFHAGILNKNRAAPSFTGICGAGIISDNAVVSAAHCFVNSNLELENYIYAVVVDLIDFTSFDNVPIFYVIAIFTTEFQGVFDLNDIVVAKVSGSFGIGRNRYIRALDLPETYEAIKDGLATVTGFGDSWVNTAVNPISGKEEKIDSGSDKQLKFALVNIFYTNMYRLRDSLENMGKEFYGSIVAPNPNVRWGICAFMCRSGENGVLAGIQPPNCETVTGDSGNPLVIGNKLIGIVSKGTKLCYDGAVGSIYAQVSRFVSFIRLAVYGNPELFARYTTNVHNIRRYFL